MVRTMADLLTHVLAAYIVGTLLSFRYTWLTRQYVTVVMIGAMLPDLNRLHLLLHPYVVETTFGAPFSWFGLHTFGGIVFLSLSGAVLVGTGHRGRVVALLLLGTVSHLALNALLFLPSGLAPPLWWPVTEARLSTPGLYLSYHRESVVAGLVAAGVWYLRRIRPATADLFPSSVGAPPVVSSESVVGVVRCPRTCKRNPNIVALGDTTVYR
jgi:hypothetical protein